MLYDYLICRLKKRTERKLKKKKKEKGMTKSLFFLLKKKANICGCNSNVKGGINKF